jgi:hypothetical protein
MPAENDCFLPRSINSPSRIQTSSQKSCVIVSFVSTPASKRRRRVTSPVWGSWLRIFWWTPAPPAPPVADAGTVHVVDVPNGGAIPGLPDDVVVEVSAFLGRDFGTATSTSDPNQLRWGRFRMWGFHFRAQGKVRAGTQR